MSLLVLTALGTEARAVAATMAHLDQDVRVVRCGMGPARATARAREVLAGHDGPVAILGFCGAVSGELRPGDTVVATEVRDGDAVRACPSAPLVATALEQRTAAMRGGRPPVALGPLRSLDHVAGIGERARLRADGVLAVDMESAALLEACGERPAVVVRTVVDDARHSLWSLGTPARVLCAWAGLRVACPAVADWAAATGDHEVVLASPRSFCAGVERAIEIVEAALERSGPPVYVRKQIVHNRHVVADLEARGAVFVDEVGAVPEGATVIFSAHGVAPAVREAAAARQLQVIDATCPLVNKVHAEARRFAEQGQTILLIGHRGHEEVEGTFGEAPAAMRILERAEDVAGLEVADPTRVAFLTQTTLALDETGEVVGALRARFPDLAGPPSEDICYATTNRQDALKAVAAGCDAVLVVGSENSSNSRRLVEVCERMGTPARLVDDETGIDLRWLAGRRRIGVTAGASASEALVERVIGALRGLGPLQLSEHVATTESVRFHPPKVAPKVPPKVR